MEEGFKVRNRVFEKLMDIENNRVNWEMLCCADKPLVPFMGAGTSAWCYPLWDQLLENIVEKTYSKKCAKIVRDALECAKNETNRRIEGLEKNDNDEEEEFSWMEEIAECIFNSNKEIYTKEENENEHTKEKEVLSNLRNYVGKEWIGKKLEAEQALYRTFSPEVLKENRTRPEYQNYFPILFQDILVTTNYDKALEYCYPSILSYSYNDLNWDKENQKDSWLFKAVIEKLTQMNDRLEKKESGLPSVTVPEMPMLLKVHGSIERASDIALTREGYNKAYCTELIRLLQTIFLKSTLLFIGCSLGKDRITDELKRLKKEEGKEGQIRHFAFLPLNKEGEQKNLDQYGICPIYYDESVLDELFEDHVEQKRVFHDYCLGVLFENLVRRKKGYSNSMESLWEKNRYRQEKLLGSQKSVYRNILRKQMLEQRENQYVRREEAVQIWEMLNSWGECPLIAIIGSPGSGKSRLCESIQKFQDGCSNTMQFFNISLANCKSWDEFCIRLLQKLNIMDMDVPEMQEWHSLAQKVADKCCAYWRSVLVLDHMDDLKTEDHSGELWETIKKMLNYWKEHKTRVIFTCHDYPNDIFCHTWRIGNLKKEEAEKVFFGSCTAGHGREITYLERKVVGELFAKQVFHPSSINLLGKYANSKNDLTGLLEEWELYYRPGDNGDQTVARIIWQHLLREHRYEEEKNTERQKEIKQNIIWIWGILGNYPGMVPCCFFESFFDSDEMRAIEHRAGYKNAELSKKTLIFMKNIGLCREVENENQINLLENMIDCVDTYFIQRVKLIQEWQEPSKKKFAELSEMIDGFRIQSAKEAGEGLKTFRGYCMDEWESGLKKYVWEELSEEEKDIGEDATKSIIEVLKILGDKVKDNKQRAAHKELNLVLHYEIKTVISFLYTCILQSKGKKKKERKYVRIGYCFAHYYHYVPAYAEPLVSRFLKIMERDIKVKKNGVWKQYEIAEMYRVMADIKRLLGRKEEALKYYDKAEALCHAQILSVLEEKDNDFAYRESRRIQADVLLIHNYYEDNGQIEENEWEKPLAIYESLEDIWGKAYYYQRLGEMKYASSAEFGETKKNYDEAAKLYGEIDDKTGTAYIWKCKGDLVVKNKCSWEENEFWMHSAMKCYLEAFLCYCQNINWRGFANVIQAMETFFRENADMKKIKNVTAMEKMYGLSEECYRWLGDVRGLADTLDYMGYGYSSCEGELYVYKALRCWSESRNLWEQQGNIKKCDKVKNEIELLKMKLKNIS